ncbi:ribosomal protein L17 [Pseudovirgaria hyperparasitica]|uniref:Large ribosomal subunit protein bL17m n=1 Tax=Pseudovirgaria hyperparasitica TaxID=470096 RepID=A0A6A6WA70_9PEZI|nr:ribosomal protein L17 [Pseudovirgaria hyperparasitica]KAF2759465.1 ribosomal protein L17 [Pseudovirgaria hyperparasitica]
MAGGHSKFRKLGRDTPHRRSLLRNLVTSLFVHEQIQTTWHKAKEAQRVAEKLVTLAKRNTPASRIRLQGELFQPEKLMGKMFTEIRQRYAERPGGYTRVLRIEPLKEDQAESAILELVDGPKDMRFAMTAKTIALIEREKKPMNDLTRKNLSKVLRYRPGGEKSMDAMVDKMRALNMKDQREGVQERPKKAVYPDHLEEFKKDPRWIASNEHQPYKIADDPIYATPQN